MAENAVQAINNVKPAPFSQEWFETQQGDYNAIKIARQRGDYDEYMAGRPVKRDSSAWEALTDWISGSYSKYENEYQNALKAYAANYINNTKADSTYTRMVQDLKNAGINPYYALMNGGLSPSSNAYQAFGDYPKAKTQGKDASSTLASLLTSAVLLMKLISFI